MQKIGKCGKTEQLRQMAWLAKLNSFICTDIITNGLLDVQSTVINIFFNLLITIIHAVIGHSLKNTSAGLSY